VRAFQLLRDDGDPGIVKGKITRVITTDWISAGDQGRRSRLPRRWRADHQSVFEEPCPDLIQPNPGGPDDPLGESVFAPDAPGLRVFAPERMLAVYAVLNVLLMAMVMGKLGWISVGALFASFFFMSIMFPTIFALGIAGLGGETKKASSYIVMAIVGGAVVPMLMGFIAAPCPAGAFINNALVNHDNDSALYAIKSEVREFCSVFPLFNESK